MNKVYLIKVIYPYGCSEAIPIAYNSKELAERKRKTYLKDDVKNGIPDKYRYEILEVPIFTN